MYSPLLLNRAGRRVLSYDVVIVGGGVAGLCNAISLAEGGLRVAVVEGKRVGVGASGSFQGILHTGAAYALRRPDLAAELRYASSLWDVLVGLQNGATETWLTTNSPEAFLTFSLNAHAARVGFDIVSRDELSEVFTIEAARSLQVARVSQLTVSPREVMTRLAQRALDLGVDIQIDNRAVDLMRDGNRVTGVVTRAGCINGDVTVLAAGLGNSELMKAAGVGRPEDIIGISGMLTVVNNRSLTVAVRSMDAGGTVAVPHDGVVDLNVSEYRQPRARDGGRPLLATEQAVAAVEAARQVFRTHVLKLSSAMSQPAIKPEFLRIGESSGGRNLSATVQWVGGAENLLLVMPGKFTLAPLAAMEAARLLGVRARNPLSEVGERVGPTPTR